MYACMYVCRYVCICLYVSVSESVCMYIVHKLLTTKSLIWIYTCTKIAFETPKTSENHAKRLLRPGHGPSVPSPCHNRNQLKEKRFENAMQILQLKLFLILLANIGCITWNTPNPLKLS